jgi:hypothetical protein
MCSLDFSIGKGVYHYIVDTNVSMTDLGFVKQFLMSWYTHQLHSVLKKTIKHTSNYVNQDRYEFSL